MDKICYLLIIFFKTFYELYSQRTYKKSWEVSAKNTRIRKLSKFLKILVQKILVRKKNFVWKKILAKKKSLVRKKVVIRKKKFVKKNVGPKKNVYPKKNFGPKKSIGKKIGQKEKLLTKKS